MTERAAFKRLVRERVARTGESYTTARRHVLAAGGRPDDTSSPPRGQHRVASLIQHALAQCSPGEVYSEAMVAGLAGGIGFMYFVFSYADTPPMLTIVAQHHPEPWVPAALSRLGVPVDVSRAGRPPWQRLRKALAAGRPVFCTVDKSRLPWHGLDPGPAVDPYPVLVTGHDGGDTVFVLDEVTGPQPISTAQFEAAWSAYRKGRHEMIVPTGPAGGAPDVAGAVARTVAHLTSPVLGNNFDVNFGFSGMAKFASQLRDTTTKSGWARRFGEPVAFFHGVRRLYDCIEVEYTSPGATRPLYAEFLAEIGQPEAAALVRESGARWSASASLALDTVAGLGEYAELCEQQLLTLMQPGADARDRVRALGAQATALATAYGPPSAARQRELFDALADLVEACARLERQAATLLVQ